jgi:Cu/Ag efflux protein CusF
MARFYRTTTGRIAAAALATSLAGFAAPCLGQAGGPVAGVGQSGAVTVRATVKSIDLATRHVTLVGPEGNPFTLKIGDLARNLDQVHVGDQVRAAYYRSVVFVLSAPNAPLPADSIAAAAASAPKGDLPAGAAMNRVTITGLVVGVDPAAHTLQMIDPTGGEIHTIAVTDPQRQAQLQNIKVGDTITTYITEALLVSVDRA